MRNALRRPPFIKYYLTFLLPDVARKLERAGFDVDVRAGVFEAPYGDLRLVVATKHGGAARDAR